MTLSAVLFLFLAHLGIGIIFTFVFVSRAAGVKFFRFNSGLAAILIAAAFVFRPPDAAATTPGHFALVAIAIAEASVVVYWATVGRIIASIRPSIVATGVGAGVVALVAQALEVASGRAVTVQAMTVASFLSSAALLGGACTAMILGHWYLVIPSLEASHLQ